MLCLLLPVNEVLYAVLLNLFVPAQKMIDGIFYDVENFSQGGEINFMSQRLGILCLTLQIPSPIIYCSKNKASFWF
jgi:hypothetical protein